MKLTRSLALQQVFYLIALVFLAGCLQSCSVMPEKGNKTQSIYALEESLEVAINGVTAANKAGDLTGDRYERAKKLEVEAQQALINARTNIVLKQKDQAEYWTKQLTDLINQIAVFNGGKK